MAFCRSQADNTHTIVIRTFSEDHHIKGDVDLSDSDEANFPVIEPVIFALKRRIPIEVDRRLQRNTVLGPVDDVFRRIIFDFRLIYVHPLKDIGKDEWTTAVKRKRAFDVTATLQPTIGSVPRILLPGSGGSRWFLLLLPGSVRPCSVRIT
jgi:hypothetical protein